MKTLIVENDYTGRLLLEEILKEHGPVHFAGNGVEAVRAVQDSLTNQSGFDLICMDIMMPVMDGVEAVGRIRDLEANHGLSRHEGSNIIVTTVLSERAKLNDPLSGLCDGYIVKPISKIEITARLKALGLIG